MRAKVFHVTPISMNVWTYVFTFNMFYIHECTLLYVLLHVHIHSLQLNSVNKIDEGR